MTLVPPLSPLILFHIDIDYLWQYLGELFDSRIVILDGGMGTQLQTYKLEEEHYRGTIPSLRHP